MLATTRDIETFVTLFERFETSAGRAANPLTPLRKAAIARFAELGFPTTRHEEWRSTNVAPIARTTFNLASQDTPAVGRSQIADVTIADDRGSRLVFVNGRYQPDLSEIRALPDGVQVCTLTDAIDADPHSVICSLARYAAFDDEPFVALNTAFLGSGDGAFIRVPKGVAVPGPIHLLYVATGADQPTASHPRNLILADVSSQVTVVETYAGVGDGPCFTNAVTELIARDNAVVDHYKIGLESLSAQHVGTLQVHQSRDSDVSSHAVTLGGALVRNNINTVLDGEGARCTLNGLYMLSGTQHVDNHLRVDHAAPHCDSRESFKGVLDDRSHGVFTGRIIVREDAQKTDGKQTNQNLLLSDQALADSKPQLEIFADDVKCTHGATIGQVDDEAIFYLRSRGLTRASARSLLILAFAREGIEAIRVEPLRRRLEERILARLPQGQSIGNGPWPSLT